MEDHRQAAQDVAESPPSTKEARGKRASGNAIFDNRPRPNIGPGHS